MGTSSTAVGEQAAAAADEGVALVSEEEVEAATDLEAELQAAREPGACFVLEGGHKLHKATAIRQLFSREHASADRVSRVQGG